MGVTITYPGTLPDINSPATFNERALELYTWMVGQGSGQLLGELADMDAADFFSVQANATDMTIGRVPLIGNDVLFGKIRIGTNSAGSETDLKLTSNSVIASEISISLGTSDATGSIRFLTGLDDAATGTAGGTEVMEVSADALDLNGARAWGFKVTVADDAVAVVDLPADRKGGFVFVSVYSGGSPDNVQNLDMAILSVDAGSSSVITEVYVGSDVESNSSLTLTGTTGTDGKTTFAPNTTGGLQIENRSGESQTYEGFFL